MGWFSGKSSTEDAPTSSMQGTESLTAGGTESLEDPNTFNFDKTPIFALDQLKRAGVPLDKQISPYLQMDPSVFRETTPQYILPSGESKGELEFAMGRIGWAVLGGFSLGCLRGFLPELRNPDTRQLPFKPFMTRLMNASVKHGSGYAHPAGAIVFMFSVIEMLMGKMRARDELNSIAAGGVTGAIFRSAHGARASALGAGFGAAAALIWLLSDQDSRQRLWKMKAQLSRPDYDY